MKRALALLAVMALLPLTACAPTTTLQLFQVAVNAFVVAETIDHGGTWTYGQLTTDTAACVAAWPTDNNPQRVNCVTGVATDVANTPNCDVKCKAYAAAAAIAFTGVIDILQPKVGTSASTSTKTQVESVYQQYKEKWNATNPPKKARLK
jgi:hypothetical protein